MKQMRSILVFSALVIFGLGCASHQDRTTASVTAPQYEDLAMVNVVSANRMPAAAGSVELSVPTADASVSTQLIKMPGETIQHGILLFTVKNHPEIAGQIMGNSGGSKISSRFTEVVNQIYKNGPNAKAQSALTSAQTKFKQIATLGAEERTDAIKTALLETREQLLAAY